MEALRESEVAQNSKLGIRRLKCINFTLKVIEGGKNVLDELKLLKAVALCLPSEDDKLSAGANAFSIDEDSL